MRILSVLFIAIIIFMSFPIPISADSQVTFDASSNSGLMGAVDTKTFSHTCGASANLLLFTECHSGGGFISSVTYNSESLTVLRAVNEDELNASIYYLVNPPTGAAHDVVVTYTSAITQGVAGVVSYSNVDTSDAFDINTYVIDGFTDPYVDFSTHNDGELVFNTVISQGDSLTTDVSERWNFNTGGFNYCAADTGSTVINTGYHDAGWSGITELFIIMAISLNYGEPVPTPTATPATDRFIGYRQAMGVVPTILLIAVILAILYFFGLGGVHSIQEGNTNTAILLWGFGMAFIAMVFIIFAFIQQAATNAL